MVITRRAIRCGTWIGVAAVIAGCGSSASGTSSAHSSTTAGGGAQSGAWVGGDTTAASPCRSVPLFQSGTTITAGIKAGCAGIGFGTELVAADCTGSTVPSGLTTSVYDQRTQAPSQLGAVRAGSGACELTSQSSNVLAQVGPSGPLPGSVAVVLDFIAPGSAQFIGVDVRCQKSNNACLTVFIGAERYTVADGSSSVAVGSYSRAAAGGPSLPPGQPSRLVLWVKANRAAAYLNGRLLGRGPTQLPDVEATADVVAIPEGAIGNGHGDTADISVLRYNVYIAT